MRAIDVMTSGVQTIAAQAAAADAWELMRRSGIHHLVVMDGADVAGVLSDGDAGGRNGAAVRARARVADLMTAPVVTVEPTTPVREIANLLRGRSIGCVPVVKGRHLVGIVTVTDVLELVGRGGGRTEAPARHELHHRVPHRKHKAGSGMW